MVEREDPFDDIGYHYVIGGSANLRYGRPLDVAGAHVGGQNSNLIGICVTGNNLELENAWVAEQKHALLRLITSLRVTLGYMPVKRHSDLAATKCPGLDDGAWYELLKPISLVG
jgi:hypothetical protein